MVQRFYFYSIDFHFLDYQNYHSEAIEKSSGFLSSHFAFLGEALLTTNKKVSKVFINLYRTRDQLIFTMNIKYVKILFLFISTFIPLKAFL